MSAVPVSEIALHACVALVPQREGLNVEEPEEVIRRAIGPINGTIVDDRAAVDGVDAAEREDARSVVASRALFLEPHSEHRLFEDPFIDGVVQNGFSIARDRRTRVQSEDAVRLQLFGDYVETRRQAKDHVRNR